MTATIDKRLFFILSVSFVFATVIGTLSHEFGHFILARIMGFHSTLHYAMTELGSNKPMTVKQEFWIILAGPLETMITGTVGFILLYKSHRQTTKLSIGEWVLVFLTLFWLRESANFVVGLGFYFAKGILAQNGDEVRLSEFLNWSDWSILSATALIGFVVLAFVIFKIIPRFQRLTFILAGLIGGITGYLFWLVYFGKMIMP